jgi:hypothetical protein
VAQRSALFAELNPAADVRNDNAAYLPSDRSHLHLATSFDIALVRVW